MNLSEEVLDAKYLRPYEQRRLTLLRSLIPDGQGDDALDLGCGSGIISDMLVQRGWSVTAVDLHPDNVIRARARVANAIQGDAVSVSRSLVGKSYGLICATELIEHLDEDDRRDLLTETRRLAKSGARLLLSTPNKMSPEGLEGYYYRELIRHVRFYAWDRTHQRIYSSFEILAALRSAGWRPVKVVGYHYRGNIVSLPLDVSSCFPLNRFGFNIIILSEPA
jgi:2-polyprenyl-3-methyl-5-hydroxy-6-metoxy-1,4-benzoquinol methylase